VINGHGSDQLHLTLAMNDILCKCMYKCEIQPLVKHGFFKVCNTLKIIEDVGFHVFKALKEDDITCVSNGTSFFNSSNNSSTLQ